ncbi:MAG: hypothetical protein KC978_06150, partial [Candidatus Omnitrophica bacterium]|nr:hypothetical protein [Candidatus Omnitrophota bacterium]
TTEEVWIPNQREGDADKSLGVFNTNSQSLSFFVADATDSAFLESDRGLGKVFVASQNLQSIYILSATSAKTTSQLDLSVIPQDIEVDIPGNTFSVLSQQGRLYLVSDRPVGTTDTPPRLTARRLGYGANPRAGLLFDSERDRLYVGRQPKGQPVVLDTNGYQPIVNLPKPAEAIALDTMRNEIYLTSPHPSDLFKKEIWKVDGDTLADPTEELSVLNDVPLPAGRSEDGEIEMTITGNGQTLWVSFPGYFFPPRLIAIDTIDGTSDEYSDFPMGFIGNLRGIGHRILVTVRDIDSDKTFIYSFSSVAGLGSPDIYDLNDDFIDDAVLDENAKRVYYLAYSDTQNDYHLIAFDLDSNTFLEQEFTLEFLDESTEARLTLNPQTERFAIASFPDSQVHFFDNPFPNAAKDAKGVVPAFEVFQSPSSWGIDLHWLPNGAVEDHIKGWIVERRRDPGSDRPPYESWICLTPRPLPPDLDYWTDTTASPGVDYRYRVIAQSKTDTPIQPVTLGPIQADPQDMAWRATFPEVSIALHPGETRELTFLAEPIQQNPYLTGLQARAEGPISFETTETFVSLPVAERFILSSSPEASPGLYFAEAVIESGSLYRSYIPMIVEVAPDFQTAPVKNAILREPTHISLSSDSELDDSRMSVRGQLGVLRDLASPSSVEVQVLFADGSIRSNTGVVAATGEFTVEFEVPPTHPSGEEVIVRATWPGSPDAVGGSSNHFHLPIYRSDGEKGTGEEIDLGEVITVSGPSPEGANADSANYLARKIVDTFSSRRLSEDQKVFSELTQVAGLRSSTPTYDVLKSTLSEGITTDKFVLLYIRGDAIHNDVGKAEILMTQQERITPGRISELIGLVRQKNAIPLVVLDCPYAGEFKDALVDEEGCFLFCCQPGFQKIRFGLGGFSDWLLLAIEEGLGFGEAFAKPSSELERLTASEGGFGQEPNEINADANPYRTLAVGSAFTPPRALLPDKSPPSFISPSSNIQAAEAQSEVELSVNVVDTPFNLDLDVTVEVRHPDGWRETLPLVRVDKETGLYSGKVRPVLPGKTLLQFQARDLKGNLETMPSSLVVSDDDFGPDNLLFYLGELKDRKEREEGGRVSDSLFWVGFNWH